MLSKINYQIFTMFGLGKLPASGTFASAATLFFYYLLYHNLSNLLLLIFLIIITLYSIFFLQKILNNFENEDPKEIVIDEFIGQLIPLLICNGELVLVIISFILFRFFDILKIFPANYFDKKIKGTIGIIGDDIIAGLYSLLAIYFIKLYV